MPLTILFIAIQQSIGNVLNFVDNIQISELNPFVGLKETEIYPYARSLRTSFLEKIMDAFYVFCGNPFVSDTRHQSSVFRFFHFGLVDYATLGIMYFIQRYIAWQVTPNSKLWIIITVGIMQLPISLVRALTAAVLTILSIPFIAIAQLATHILSNEYKKHINEYEYDDEISTSGQSTRTMFAMLKAYNCEIGDITDIDFTKDIENGVLKIEYTRSYHSKSEFRIPINSNGQLYRSNDIKFFNALQLLNVGRIQEKIEAGDVQPIDFQL